MNKVHVFDNLSENRVGGRSAGVEPVEEGVGVDVQEELGTSGHRAS